MSLQLNFLSLQKAELAYEVALRGGSHTESVQDLRKQIVKLSKDMLSEDILESHLDPEVDISELKESMAKAKSNIALLKAKFEKNLFLRTEVLINHMNHRLIRISASNSEDFKSVSSKLNSLNKDLQILKTILPTSQPSTSNQPETSLEQPVLSVTCERNSIFSDINKLKFNGKNCVRAFIQRVEEYVQSRNISYEKIFTHSYDMFTDEALHWFRCVKDNVKSWSELTILLKSDFSITDYEYRLMNEIRSRTQGERENITIYVAIMHGMFSRLDRPLTEEEKLEILLHNIRPTYASTIAASPEIQSVDALKAICKNFESIQSRLTQFHEPPQCTSQTLAPEFAYSKAGSFTTPQYRNNNNYNSAFNKNYNNNSYNKNNNNNNNFKRVAAVTVQGNYAFACPRCRSNSHELKHCKEPKTILCFGCGKKDVRRPDCTVCNRNNNNLTKPKN